MLQVLEGKDSRHTAEAALAVATQAQEVTQGVQSSWEIEDFWNWECPNQRGSTIPCC